MNRHAQVTLGKNAILLAGAVALLALLLASPQVEVLVASAAANGIAAADGASGDAVFANSSTCAPGINTSVSLTINGNVVTNNGLRNSSPLTINGYLTYQGTISNAGTISYNPTAGNPIMVSSARPWPAMYDVGRICPGWAGSPRGRR